nr:hypothetical protein [Tanacetum cinerariifolium]
MYNPKNQSKLGSPPYFRLAGAHLPLSARRHSVASLVSMPALSRLLRLLSLLLLLSPVLQSYAQQTPTDTTRRRQAGQNSAIRNVELSNVDVLPNTDTKGWLLLDKDIQLELDGAVQNLYNFKYDKAEKQFRSLRRRYPHHPMPYFLLGLSTWWKIMPTNFQTKQYDKIFYAYMDTANTYSEQLAKADPRNYEAYFFLSAANGFDARLNAERHNWRKATVSSKRALNYLQKSREANGLSPEFLFGEALFNYYAVWIPENYPLLKPVLLFFPKGDKKLGLEQLRNVATNASSGRYASYFLGYLMQYKYKDLAKAKDYYQRCIVFAESNGETEGGFYLFANASLAKLADQTNDAEAARRYYAV